MIDTARPLYDDMAEQGILGAILCRPECFEDVALAVELTGGNGYALLRAKQWSKTHEED